MSVDFWGLVLAAVAPILVLLGGAWLWYRLQAPAKVFNVFKGHYDQQHPPCPFAAAAMVDGDGVTFELIPATRHRASTELPVEEITCSVIHADHRSPLREALHPTEVRLESPITVRYPADFDHTVWPLMPGKHELVWQVKTERGDYSLGSPFRIKRR